MRNFLFSILIIGLSWQYIFMTPVLNVKEESLQNADKDVKDLESLRVDSNKPNDAKPHVPDNAEIPKIPASTSSPEIPAISKSGIFRHRGITQAKKNKYYGEKPASETDVGAVMPYTPADLAWYILSTGDEEGVAVVVEELVRIGLVGRTDAINYLQDVKQTVNYMKEFYNQMKNNFEQSENTPYSKLQFPQKLSHLPRPMLIPNLSADKREPVSTPAPSTEAPKPSTEEPKKPDMERPAQTVGHPEILTNDNVKTRMPPQNSYDDFTLEIIYKLSKDMFTQSILRDDPTAEDTLSGLLTFLENRHISQEMKEKVLLVVIGALLEALQENNQTYVPPDYLPELYRKLAAEGHESRSPLGGNNRQKAS